MSTRAYDLIGNLCRTTRSLSPRLYRHSRHLCLTQVPQKMLSTITRLSHVKLVEVMSSFPSAELAYQD